jgi:hypothetical protein
MPLYPLAGVKVITPDVETTYVPTPVTLIVVPGATVQFGATSGVEAFGSHSRIVVATKSALTPPMLTVLMSFVRRLIDCEVFNGPDVSSGIAVGTGSPWHIAPSALVALNDRENISTH